MFINFVFLFCWHLVQTSLSQITAGWVEAKRKREGVLILLDRIQCCQLCSFISCIWYTFIQCGNFRILREMNFEPFGQCTSSKIALYAFFGSLNFVNLINFSLQKVPKFIASNCVKKSRFALLVPKIERYLEKS